MDELLKVSEMTSVCKPIHVIRKVTAATLIYQMALNIQNLMYFTYHPTPSLAIENLYTNQIILRRVINVQVLLTWFE